MLNLSPSSYEWHRRHSADVTEHALNLSHWDQTYDQISRGPFLGQLDELWLGDIQLFRERTSAAVLERGSAWPGSQTFGLPIAMQGSALYCGEKFGLDDLMTLSGGDGLDLHAPPGFDIIAITLSAEKFQALARTLYPSNAQASVKMRRVLSIAPSSVAPLRELVLQVLDTAERNPMLLQSTHVLSQIRTDLNEALLTALGSVANDEPPPSPLIAQRKLVQRARELVEANSTYALSVAELCAALNISRRSLQNYFRSILGVTPHQYLQMQRMNNLRRALQRANPKEDSVRDIASRWGFWHLSSCAADYKRLFGELPSATLRGVTLHA